MRPYFCCVVIIAFEKYGAYPWCATGETHKDALARTFDRMCADVNTIKELVLENCQQFNFNDLNYVVNTCLTSNNPKTALMVMGNIKGMRITETYIYQPN
jgi:hypothetical protein